jgi:hypothetical protein
VNREDLSFEYTPDQWVKLSRLLEKQYAAYQWTATDIVDGLLMGKLTYVKYITKAEQITKEKGGSNEQPTFTDGTPVPDAHPGDEVLDVRHVDFSIWSLTDIIRFSLECEASDFRFDRYHAPSPKTIAKAKVEAKKVIQCCDFIASVLSPDAGAELLKLLVELRKEAESELRSFEVPSKRHRRHDTRRQEYLSQLCRFWVALGGTPTTSFNGLEGHAAGDFVDFILLAAGPVLTQLTNNGARRAIENWREREPSGVGKRIVFINNDPNPYLLPPRQPPAGYVRLKNRRPRKQS